MYIRIFNNTTSSIYSVSRQAYINRDYTIDLLYLHTNTFYENTTARNYFLEYNQAIWIIWNDISHKLFDNVFTNNCARDTFLVYQHIKYQICCIRREGTRFNSRCAFIYSDNLVIIRYCNTCNDTK